VVQVKESSRRSRAEERPGKKVRQTPEAPTDVDLAILAVLRRNARTPNNAIAAEVGVAPSTCLTRIRALEQAGTIRGYYADVGFEALGTPLEALIAVRLRAGTRHRLGMFTDNIKTRPEVLDIFFVAGDEDFLIHVALRDTVALRDFVVDHLSGNVEVASTRTQLVFEHIKCAVYGGVWYVCTVVCLSRW
jgi:DNA-binding Lrp family transcriptional regulator